MEGAKGSLESPNKPLAVFFRKGDEGKHPPVRSEPRKMYCFCTASLPIRAISAILEDVAFEENGNGPRFTGTLRK